jgi:uncharacterized protein (TIGR03790 family)
MKTFLVCSVCLFLIFLSSSQTLATSDQANRVMVIFNNYSTYTYDQNANGLQDSYELALFYAAKRDIPLGNLLGVNCTRGNTYYYYANTSYPTFLSEIDVPVKNKLAQLGEENIDYFAMIYGIPYQIFPSTNMRSLDDYIAIPFDIDSSGAYSSNLYQETSPGISSDKGHFNHSYKSSYGHNTYLVSRLDGQYVDQIRDQVYGALYGETYLYNSLGYYRGIGYVDNRYGSYSDNFSGYPFGYYSYGNADKSMAYAYTFFADKNYPYKREVNETEIGDAGSVFLDGSNASIAENATLYGGWYNFGKYPHGFRWLPGSVACDYNSNSVSAQGLRAGGTNFGYQAMQDGLTSVVGVIDEPSLGGHPMPEVLLYYLLNGYNLAESARLSMTLITWRNIVIGDPIYTPLGQKDPAIDSSFSRNLTIFDDTVPSYSAEQRKISVYLTEGPVPEMAVFKLECWNESGFSNITDYNIDYRFKKEFILQNLSADTTYYYKITARDPNGNTKENPVSSFTTYTNNSAAMPSLSIARDKMAISSGESVSFNGSSNCLDCTYTWIFGDGAEYADKNAAHFYNKKGVYDVFLHAINGQGVALTKRTIVFVLNESASLLQNCSQLGGACCSSGQICQGGYLPAYDCLACCAGTCRTISCGDTYCDPGESCSSCPQDCLPGGQVCCSGTAYAGNCCSDPECSSPLVCISHSCSQPLASLAAHWKLDESSGTTASDSSGNGNTGTLVNGPVWTMGNISGALSFDGVDDRIDITDSSSLEGMPAITISAWIRSTLTGTDNYQRIVDKYYASAYSFYITNPGIISAAIYTTGTGGGASDWAGGQFGKTLTANVWQHVVFVWDSSTAQANVYLNGNPGTAQAPFP